MGTDALPLLRPVAMIVDVLEAMMGKTLGVDLQVWLHQAACVYASHLVLHKRYDTIGAIIEERVKKMIARGVTPFLVLDGETPFSSQAS